MAAFHEALAKLSNQLKSAGESVSSISNRIAKIEEDAGHKEGADDFEAKMTASASSQISQKVGAGGGSVVPITCPKCGGAVQIPEETTRCFCTFCGTQLFVDDGTRTVTYRTVDEARIKEVEVEKELELKRLEIEEARRPQRLKAAAILALIGVGMIVIGEFAGDATGDDHSPWYMLALLGMFPFFGSFYMLLIGRK